jgi:hypothetical protein
MRAASMAVPKSRRRKPGLIMLWVGKAFEKIRKVLTSDNRADIEVGYQIGD